MSWYKQWKTCRKILCVRPDNIGDIILMTPVFRALKETFPQASITLLTSSVGKMITPFIKNIDDVIIYDAPWIENTELSPSQKSLYDVVDEIQKREIDGAILLTNFSQNPLPLATLTYLAKIPKVLGYSREYPNQLITYWVPDYEPFTFPIHGVKRQLNLLESIGVSTTTDKLSLSLPDEVRANTTQLIKRKHIQTKKPLIVMHTGASLPRRRYPLPLFYETARQLIKELDAQILLTGTKKEKEIVEAFRGISKSVISLVGETSLGEFIGIIEKADILVSNNTSAVHIAAAMNTPVVDLYARSNPEHTPWHVPHRMLYFDIPEGQRTKNTLLLNLISKVPHPYPQPYHTVTAVKELLLNKETTCLPVEITTWDISKLPEYPIQHKFLSI